MDLLLDTHIALWALADDARLSPPARSLILEPANTVAVSAVSVWEIAIKHALSKGNMPVSGSQALAWFKASGYEVLDISADVAAAVEKLPALHGDPFDRLLVAQAARLGLRRMTHDATVAKYADTIIRV
ncbi:type II toxin-antitoxin system VapC family toxin [Leptothrix discophora]|uniref:Type II toxin-antitoxin system VapC family toxin n=1 Tax=Leptothrix discophora TaxID=89 RepID=A0ABT9G038_LEPDI|nr:type II toxin-antitoxin system VapC family toxin [Leptothrix discophora]MDP4299842.1 type II toxin-antitoxin system VapC family toxin [Leptothrix discophora]